MKRLINFLSFTLFIFLFSNITALALEECKYYDKDNNELVLEVGGSKGNYYFKDTTYGFSTKTNLKNGVCPTSVIKLSNGIICAPGYKVKDLNKKEAICNNSLSTGILYESEKSNKTEENPKKENEEIIIADETSKIENGKTVSVYVEGQKTNISGKLIDSRTYVSLDQLCNILDCRYGYKKAKKSNGKTYKQNYILTITTPLTDVSSEFGNSFFELEYNLKDKKYSSYVNLGNNQNNSNRFKMKDLNETAAILKGDYTKLPDYGTSNESLADLYVPIRVVSNGLGKDVTWDGNNNVIYIEKPDVEYTHVLTDFEDFEVGRELPESTAVTGEKIKINKGRCYSAVAVDSNNKVLNYTTAFSFYNENTANRANSKYQFETKKFLESSDYYIGTRDSICAIGNTGDNDEVLVFSIKNYFPSISKYVVTTVGGEEEETSETRTIINVPNDSRPVTRSNFETLVKASGFNYIEVNSGLDSYNGSTWYAGNINTVQNDLAVKIANTKTDNKSVILNLSSYMFGGLIGTRNPLMYTENNINNSLTKLENLIQNNPNTTFYINAVIPRTLPDVRAYNWGNGTYKNILGKTTSYTQAFSEWAYLYYLEQDNNAAYIKVPSKYKDYKDDFYRENKTNCDLYINMFRETKNLLTGTKYKSNLEKILDDYNNVVLTLGVDDYELPDAIEELSKDAVNNWIPFENGFATKYCGGYNVYKDVYAELKNKIINTYAVDEVNHIILAREISKTRGSRVKVSPNYSPSNVSGFVGSYSRNSNTEIISNFIKFINEETKNNGIPVNIKAYLYADNSTMDSYVNNIYSAVNKGDNVMLVSLNHYSTTKIDKENAMKLFNNILEKGSMFNIASYGGWNTNGNAIGIQLAKNVVYDTLKRDIDKCIDVGKCTTTKLTSELESRVKAYDSVRLATTLEDIVFNRDKTTNMSSFQNSINYKKTIEEFESTNFKIGRYKYNYSSISVSASSPWNRDFEVKLNISLN